MAKETYLYEVLIRGNVKGEISGCHVIYRDRYTMDDGKIIEQERGAEVVELDAVPKLLGQEMAGVVAQVASLTAERDAAMESDKAKADTLAQAKSAFEQIKSTIAQIEGQ